MYMITPQGIPGRRDSLRNFHCLERSTFGFADEATAVSELHGKHSDELKGQEPGFGRVFGTLPTVNAPGLYLVSQLR